MLQNFARHLTRFPGRHNRRRLSDCIGSRLLKRRFETCMPECLEGRINMAGELAVYLTNSVAVPENQPVSGAIVGSLYPANFVDDATLHYEVLSVDGVDSDDRFYAVENRLLASGVFDFEQFPFHDVLIRATASNGASWDSFVTVSVADGNDNANSPFTLTNYVVVENVGTSGTPLEVGQLGLRNGVGFQYQFVSGAGDSDNLKFSIEDGTLYLNEVPNAENQWMYSIRLIANTEAGAVEGSLNVDVLPVDEFPTERLIPTFVDGQSTVFIRVAENTPVGQTVATLRPVDGDFMEPFQYTIGGRLSDFLRIEQNHLIVNAPIDFEAITPELMDLSIIGTNLTSGQVVEFYQGGIGGNSSGFLPSVIDVNDAPVVSGVADQSAIAGIENRLPIAGPLYTDQDAADQGALTVILQIGGVVPDWISWNADTNVFVLSPEAPVGVYHVEIRVTDTGSKTGTGTFRLTIAEPVIGTVITGTPLDDVITVRALGAALDSPWRISVNGRTAFQGTIEQGTFVRLDGDGGNDVVRLFTGAGDNEIVVGAQYMRVAGFWLSGTNIENRSVNAQDGVDRILIQSSIADNLSIDGGGGSDSLQLDFVVGQWNINGRNSGLVNGASFVGIESLTGSAADDTFTIARPGQIAGAIDGRGGWNQIVYASDARRVDTVVTSFATLSGTTSRTGGFANIDRIEAYNSQANLLTYARESLQNPFDLVLWNLYESSLSIEVREQNNTLNLAFADFFHAAGFTQLVGSAAPDQFYLMNPSGSQLYSLDGGDMAETNNYVNFNLGTVFLDVGSSSATGISGFRG